MPISSSSISHKQEKQAFSHLHVGKEIEFEEIIDLHPDAYLNQRLKNLRCGDTFEKMNQHDLVYMTKSANNKKVNLALIFPRCHLFTLL